jgi:hypothetical protein
MHLAFCPGSLLAPEICDIPIGAQSLIWAYGKKEKKKK